MNTEQEQTEKTLAEFIAEHKLTMTVNATDHNPCMDDDDHPMDHWRCRIRQGRKSMSLTFSMGSGHNGKRPELDEVLSCLASDSSLVDQTFENFCDEFGYEHDSRKHKRTYNACIKQGNQLLALLGKDAFDELVYHTERL